MLRFSHLQFCGKDNLLENGTWEEWFEQTHVSKPVGYSRNTILLAGDSTWTVSATQFLKQHMGPSS